MCVGVGVGDDFFDVVGGVGGGVDCVGLEYWVGGDCWVDWWWWAW